MFSSMASRLHLMYCSQPSTNTPTDRHCRFDAFVLHVDDVRLIVVDSFVFFINYLYFLSIEADWHTRMAHKVNRSSTRRRMRDAALHSDTWKCRSLMSFSNLLFSMEMTVSSRIRIALKKTIYILTAKSEASELIPVTVLLVCEC